MKRILIAAILVVFASGVCLAGEKQELANENDRISYSVGYQVGGDFQRQGVTLNPDLLVKGIEDALRGDKPLMTSQEREKTLVDLKRRIADAQREDQRKLAERNLAEGKQFLEENAKKEGVRTLPSGLQYEVIREGAGESPAKMDGVTVHYRGTLIDGTEFDSSYKRGEPTTFRLNRVIAGWTEALQLMKPNAKWRLFIPSNLAYGVRSVGRIGPNSTLIFEIELIKVN